MPSRPAWPIVKLDNDRHPQTTIELSLLAHTTITEELAGFADFKVQGYYDSVVESAVKALQRAKGITIDGIVGPETWPHLVHEIERGDQNDAVLALQFENQYRNMADSTEAPGLACDGIFGPKTEKWVKGFQGAVEEKPDGIVGLRTWRHLVSGALAG